MEGVNILLHLCHDLVTADFALDLGDQYGRNDTGDHQHPRQVNGIGGGDLVKAGDRVLAFIHVDHAGGAIILLLHAVHPDMGWRVMLGQGGFSQLPVCLQPFQQGTIHRGFLADDQIINVEFPGRRWWRLLHDLLFRGRGFGQSLPERFHRHALLLQENIGIMLLCSWGLPAKYHGQQQHCHQEQQDKQPSVP